MTDLRAARREELIDAATEAFYRAHIEAVYHSPKGQAKALANADARRLWRTPVRAAVLAILDRAELAAAPAEPAREADPGLLLNRALALLSEWTVEVGDTNERDTNTRRLMRDIRAALIPTEEPHG